MPGYKIYLQDGGEIREGLTCFYCKLLLKDPVQTRKTGVRYCWECYNKSPRDPDYPDQGIWYDRAVKTEIAKLSLRCPYHMKGCSWNGQFKDSAEHEAVCGHVQRDVTTSEPHQTNSSIEDQQPSEQMMVDTGAQQLSTSTEDVRLPGDNGGQSLPHPPMGSSGFQGWVTTQLDEVHGTLANISDQLIQSQASSTSTYDGKYVWRIPEVCRRIKEAKEGRITSIYSAPFYTGRNGYKMCIRAYLNGDGSGKGTHLSIFYVIMRGEYDPLLRWPFESKVSLILVDQDRKKDLVQTFKPNAQSSSFQRPKTDMNVASGFPKFASASVYNNLSYVRDDVMYIKAVVDTSNIDHP